ncbi:MAG: sulfatase-like hydrolase/transferase [Bryobacteraceae bacterium]|nr:sulfatase-like hydrolase/transferase [Bryobacteraceae bacterium]
MLPFLLLLTTLAGSAAVRPPNVILIISDDHGWADYGFMGNRHARTPYLDKLAAESLLFTRGYVPASLCRPSLASIMTGLYPHQHRVTGNDPPGEARDAANRERMVKIYQQSKTIAGLLGAKGYVSHQSGKWWEGECKCGGFTECMTHGDVKRGGRHGDEGLKIGRQTMQPIFDFVEHAGDQPFLLWYAPFLPHTPHNPPARLLSKYTGLPPAQAKYLAMVEWLDETVGQLMVFLEKKGIAGNTLVAYVADNGWVQLEGTRPLHETRAKLSPYDAGLRTPIMVRWPGVITPRRDEATLASSIDLAPTILRACGIQPPKEMPGIDLRDRAALEKRKAIFGGLFVHTSIDLENPAANVKYRWMIRDRWKLIEPYLPNARLDMLEKIPFTGWSERAQLYDVLADPREEKDLAGERADLVRNLRRELDRWWNPAAR